MPLHSEVSKISSKFQVQGKLVTEYLESESKLSKGEKTTTLYQHQIMAVLETRKHFTENTDVKPALIVTPP
jgi:hypothetical protein